MKKISISPPETRDEFHLKWKKISISPPKTLKTLKSWNSFSLLLSRSQKLKLLLPPSLSVATSSRWLQWLRELPLFLLLAPVVTRTPSLPLARSGGYGTPRYSSDHWKSGKEISLSSPPFNFRNFGFGFGFPKVESLVSK